MAGDIKLDFSQVESFQPIPKGDYVVECVEVDGPSESQAGNQMLKLTFQIAEGEFAGRKIGNYFLLLEGNAMWRTRRDLAALLSIDDEAEDVSFDPEDLVGATVVARISQRVWKEEDGGDGEARPNITRLKAIASPAASLFG
jgi:hypothetical protein